MTLLSGLERNDIMFKTKSRNNVYRCDPLNWTFAVVEERERRLIERSAATITCDIDTTIRQSEFTTSKSILLDIQL